MGSSKTKKKKYADDSPTTESSSPSPSSSDDDDSSDRRHHSHRKDRRRREKEKRREREEKRRKRKERERKKKREKMVKRKRDYDSDDGSGSGSGSELEAASRKIDPKTVLSDMLKEFPSAANDLKQLLQMIDDGQAVDIKGISEKSLNRHLKKLFRSLNLKEKGDRVFLIRSNAPPTLDVVGTLIQNHVGPTEQNIDHSSPVNIQDSILPEAQHGEAVPDNNVSAPGPEDESSAPKRRVVGPEMPSAELLAAAAKLTEAQAELREADMEEDTALFIGPPPPALVAEAESANEAERFEEVTRIMGAEPDSPYDILGVNPKMTSNNVKKRYWKLSLWVHPDKCSHPQANQAFIKLNKAFKDLQDPEKRKALDDKIKLQEEQEAFKVELKAMREAAQWRKLQGISMEGDEELLAELEVKAPPTRDEWMTTLPPERKAGGMPTHSTSFSKNAKEGRGDTSAWTDTPMDRAQKAKMNYLEAYNEATALASNEKDKKMSNADAALVDEYNKARRSKSLVMKHQEEAAASASRPKKKKSKQNVQQEQGKIKEKDEWAGNHPWKPWDREKDLTAGRQKVKLDTENMAQGLTSRFNSGNFQRNFL
ncbi:uncharacterized protein [Rutidosis leptorrhynchoides]|uniref:uncharacterized protein n=1 Tax=Rutidosis leptorrhynchoides TaxID=125765 RepID=UPI003A98E1D8